MDSKGYEIVYKIIIRFGYIDLRLNFKEYYFKIKKWIFLLVKWKLIIKFVILFIFELNFLKECLLGGV